jgi:hypothetical protein
MIINSKLVHTLMWKGMANSVIYGTCCDLGSTEYITETSVLYYFEPKTQHVYNAICHTLSISVNTDSKANIACFLSLGQNILAETYVTM